MCRPTEIKCSQQLALGSSAARLGRLIETIAFENNLYSFVTKRYIRPMLTLPIAWQSSHVQFATAVWFEFLKCMFVRSIWKARLARELCWCRFGNHTLVFITGKHLIALCIMLQAEFSSTWGVQHSANTQTSLINGLRPIKWVYESINCHRYILIAAIIFRQKSFLNTNAFVGEAYSCASNPDNAKEEAKRRVMWTFTTVATGEHFVAAMWLMKRVRPSQSAAVMLLAHEPSPPD